MITCQVQFAPWDKIYNYTTKLDSSNVGKYVLVETELGEEIARIISFDSVKTEESLPKVIALASYDDLTELASLADKQKALEYCQEAIERLALPMKLIDVYIAKGAVKYNFAFMAENRVDFRELVKDLALYFSAQVRLTQIGARDEAKVLGDCGSCGRTLCCQSCIAKFNSISSEMAEVQQVVHRGSDRISGLCGRLMCCLAFEYEGYKHLAGKLPPIGTRLRLGEQRAEVIGHNILKQTVNIKVFPLDPDERAIIIEFDPTQVAHRK